MLSKFLFLIVLIVLSNCVMAQHINLQKNNSYHVLKIRLPKKVVINYATDSSIQTIKAKAIKYSFPNLILVQKEDTIILNAQKILSINYKPDFSVGFYVLIFPVTLFAGAFIGVAFYHPPKNGIEPFIFPFILGGTLAFTDYYLFKEANKKLNTKTVWSFY